MSKVSSKSIVEFLKLVGKLKNIPRTGWVIRNIKEPECVASHMYRMAIMAMLIPVESGIDINRCLKMSLVHDVAECIVGDLTPYSGVSKEEKHAREEAAMEKLSNLIGDSGKAISSLYSEYASQTTQEAILVKELDRLDMVLQAFEYEEELSSPGRLQEFFNSTEGKFSHPWTLKIIAEIYKQRSNHLLNEIDNETGK